ncbi:MAG: lipoate--protein ligase [Bacillota bacterium]|nr:lipoate--protein ligase [Bacillota bacterium]
MHPRLLLLRESGTNPWHNLALEDQLLAALAGPEPPADAILYLWQNDHTVVIGRNQNAWSECHTALLEEEGGRLARRTTGGGAVYHDLGNLNFSILLPQRVFDLDRSFDLIIGVVHELGMEAQRSGRNDILLDGMKFSGNAFRIDRGVGLHHGTILLNSDYGRLGRYLNVAPEKLAARGIRSVRSRVTNLSAFRPELTVAEVQDAIERAFIACYGTGDSPIERVSPARFTELPDFAARAARFASWDWNYGESIAFGHEVGERFDWGLVRLGFIIKDGRVDTARIHTDALDEAWIRRVEGAWPGLPFRSQDLAAVLEAEAADSRDAIGVSRNRMAADLAALIREQGW